jgi:exopolysaccharide production protein ExoZ
VFLAARLNRNRRALSWPEGLLGRLGDASYSIYLVQVFTISGFCKIFLKLWPSMPLSFLIMIVVIATILVGWVAYMLLERPISRVFRTVGLRTRLARA